MQAYRDKTSERNAMAIFLEIAIIPLSFSVESNHFKTFLTKNNSRIQVKNSITLRVTSVIKTASFIETSSDNENSLSGSLSCTLVIKIPAKQFDIFISDATKGIEKFDTKDIQVKDVTEEFVDIQAHLKTKRELEQPYLKLLERANKVTEILEI